MMRHITLLRMGSLSITTETVSRPILFIVTTSPSADYKGCPPCSLLTFLCHKDFPSSLPPSALSHQRYLDGFIDPEAPGQAGVCPGILVTSSRRRIREPGIQVCPTRRQQHYTGGVSRATQGGNINPRVGRTHPLNRQNATGLQIWNCSIFSEVIKGQVQLEPWPDGHWLVR